MSNFGENQPPFSSYFIQVAIPPESFDTTTYLIISTTGVPIQPDSFRIIYYPENSANIGYKDKKIIFDQNTDGWGSENGGNVILSLKDVKDIDGGVYGTILLINCSFRPIEKVTLELLKNPYIEITFDDHNNRKVPAVIDFNAKIFPSSYQIKSGKWVFSDNDISYTQSPSNLYAKQGTYTVSLTCETMDGTTVQCDTTIKIEPYDIVTTENHTQSLKCEGAVCDNDISGKGKGILFDYGTILSNFDATFEFSIGGGNSDCESPCTLFIAPEGGDWGILWSTTEGRTAKSNTTYSGHLYNEDRSFTYLAAYAPSCGMEHLNFTAHLKPTAYFTASKTEVMVGDTITLEASCIPLSSENPDDTKIVSYLWDFGDGICVPITGLKIKHIYVIPGTYQITLFITDAQGGNDYRTELITVSE